VQAFVSYPETAGKTLEEIEILFQKGGPHPWQTKPGNSLLDAKILELQRSGKSGAGGVIGGTEEEKIEYLEKHGENGTSDNGTNGARESTATQSTAVAT
jgi:hypothetical protein